MKNAVVFVLVAVVVVAILTGYAATMVALAKVRVDRWMRDLACTRAQAAFEAHLLKPLPAGPMPKAYMQEFDELEKRFNECER